MASSPRPIAGNLISKRCSITNSAVVGYKLERGKKLQFFYRQLQIADREDDGCSKINFGLKFFQNNKFSFFILFQIFMEIICFSRKIFFDRRKYRDGAITPCSPTTTPLNIMSLSHFHMLYCSHFLALLCTFSTD